MTLRDLANRKAGQWASRKARRAAYRQRTLIVANHWEGSVQQFYHFFLGYYLPLCTWLRQHPDAAIAVRDCGPMNPWFALLPDRINVEIIPPGGALHIVVGDRMAHEILAGLDDPSRFDHRRLLRSRDDVLRILGLPDGAIEPIEHRVVIVDRATSEDFYHSSESETHMSGSERRSVPNLSGLPAHLPPDTDVAVVDLARIHPKAQIEQMQGARILVGQHGAGLLHMLWMPPGSTIVEIAPPLPPEVVDIFQRLASCLGHHYERIPQKSVHSPVDLPEVAAAVTRWLPGTQPFEEEG